jgi:hypothetical protein
MPEQWLRLDPGRAHQAGADLARAGTAISGQRVGLGGEIAAASAGRPWGTDDIGSAFERQYRGFETTILAAWSGIGSYVEELGDDVVTSVEASVATDAANGHRIGQSAV